MKFMIASDIHGSAYFCERMLSAFEREGADRLVLLGDLLYHGPRNELPRDYAPKKVISMLNPLKDRLICVCGNCDAEVDQMVLDFPILSDSLVLCVGERLIFCTHGHKYNITALPPLSDGDILLYGHTHIPLCERRGGILCINPGSVSIPKENSPHSYMTFDGHTLVWKELSGEIYKSVTLD